ncbi:hypothetical protein A9P82_08595 [Arachidicoccus ginsenosidimutans]|uniref:helix-turn-helix transcriptional regulator n=1 Tax=Arachidicoccus sp. BS20 TaxID=1850526 RepID=UPI0007F11E27|nr:hypothetical protein [Arachidicoccus sp. BS20]ANI89346.1 hypothetical protein A9P82_08595 [Arachidicoccus sp. BS20]
MRIFAAILFLITICISPFSLKAQHLPTDALIEAWNASDTSQTTKAEATYADLKAYAKPSAFRQRTLELDNYLQNHYSPRLAVRIIIYKILGKRELNIPDTSAVSSIKKAVSAASSIGDKQLLSEIYTLYAAILSERETAASLFYIMKAIDVQQQIGVEHFPLIYLRYLSVSAVLYQTTNYTQSIHYGLQTLALMHTPHTDISNYCLQLDALGASYKALKKADSTIYYYQELQNILADYIHNPKDYVYHSALPDSVFVKIWKGVAKGGIAQGLFLQGKYDEAIPLLSQNIQSSIATKQFSDAALAQNTLAKINLIHEQFDSALYQSKLAYQWASQSGDLQNTITALQNISDTYKMLGKYDSAYVYNDRYHTYSDTLQAKINNSKLATINARIEYEDMQISLQHAQNAEVAQVRLRNYILAAVALLAIFAGLLYNRYRLQQNLHYERLQKEKQAAEWEAAQTKQQIANAQQQLDAFTRNISEKNILIETLQSRLNNDTNANKALNDITILTEEDWIRFKDSFEKIYPGYWLRLNQKMPELTTGEQRFMALAKLGMNNKEMAAATGVSPQSIRVTIFRLRKKINISETDNIRSIAQNI